MTYRKIGGLHWLAIGRLRLAWCITKPKPNMEAWYHHATGRAIRP